MGVSWVLGLRLWAGAVAHVAGHKLIGAVVVGVQHGNVLAEQEGARLQAHIDYQVGRRRWGRVRADGLVFVGPDEVAEVGLARGLIVVEAHLDVLGNLVVLALVVVRDDLLPRASLLVGVAAAARIRQAAPGMAIVETDLQQAPAVVVARTRAEFMDGLDVRGQVIAHEVVRVALELDRHVRGEEGHVRNARRVDGGIEVL